MLWNDSATLPELNYSIAHGGVGVTCNSVIAPEALKSESEIWNPKIRQLAEKNPTVTEDEIGWLLIEREAPLVRLPPTKLSRYSHSDNRIGS